MHTDTTSPDSLTTSIEDLRAADFTAPCSGYRQVLYLNPESRTVYVFGAVGSSWPVAAHNGIHVAILHVPIDAIGDSVADYLLRKVDLLRAVCDDYQGTRWDGHNHRGVWSTSVEDRDSPHGDLACLDGEGIACAWDPSDWYAADYPTWIELCSRHGVDPERGEAAIPELAAHEIELAQSAGAVLRDPSAALRAMLEEWHADGGI